MNTRKQEIQQLWRQYQGLYVFAGILIGLLAFPFLEIVITNLRSLIIGLVPEAIGIGFTVFLIDRIYEDRRKKEQLESFKKQLIQDARSQINHIAIKAVEEMQTRNWIQGDNGLLRKTSLWGANLANAPLVGANLSETQLNYSILKMAKMINADLTQASLQEVDLSNADLYHCNLQDCDMQNAILHKTMLVGVNLSGANLRNAKLSEIIWVREHSNYKTILPDETVVDSHTTLNMERFTNPSHELFEVTLNKINLIRQKRGIHPIPNEDFLIV